MSLFSPLSRIEKVFNFESNYEKYVLPAAVLYIEGVCIGELNIRTLEC